MRTDILVARLMSRGETNEVYFIADRAGCYRSIETDL
jgi:hypothetical protein